MAKKNEAPKVEDKQVLEKVCVIEERLKNNFSDDICKKLESTIAIWAFLVVLISIFIKKFNPAQELSIFITTSAVLGIYIIDYGLFFLLREKLDSELPPYKTISGLLIINFILTGLLTIPFFYANQGISSVSFLGKIVDTSIQIILPCIIFIPLIVFIIFIYLLLRKFKENKPSPLWYKLTHNKNYYLAIFASLVVVFIEKTYSFLSYYLTTNYFNDSTDFTKTAISTGILLAFIGFVLYKTGEKINLFEDDSKDKVK